MSIITLTTDYGIKDHFVGALKGKILSEYPEARIVDISHGIDPFNTSEAAYIVGAAYPSFPAGTVHIIGVDAERHKENQHLAMQWNDQFFVCADNGTLGMLTEKILPQQIVSINIHDRFPAEATDLDVFVKVACHIARGGQLNVIGKTVSDIKKPLELMPVVSANALKGYAIYIDHFGNVVTNITRKVFQDAAKGRPFEIVLNEKMRGDKKNIRSIRQRYADAAAVSRFSIKDYEGTKLAIFNEAGYLEIALFRSNPQRVGSASTLLGIGYRDEITIRFLND